jgi:uncharacterized protein (DUF2252 family)
VKRAVAACLIAGLALYVAGCGEGAPAREAIVVNTMVRADLPLIRTRPALVQGKYRLMASSLYAFYRGSFALYARDAADSELPIGATHHPAPGALPLSIGDAHPENFGLLVAPDDSFAVEPNDLDGADRYPYHWEVRRLCAGMAISARLAGVDEASVTTIAGAAARSYATRVTALAAGEPPARVVEEATTDPISADLFERGRDDYASREELEELTLVENGVRKLRRGGIDPDVPDNVYLDVPPFVHGELPRMIESYRQTLIAPPPAEYFQILDVARELASGVASFPRLRLILLVRGPSEASDDDVILEIKELADSGARGYLPPGVSFDGVEERVLGAARRLWARPDAEPFWGTSELLGFAVQLKRESEGLKTYRVVRFTGALGQPGAIEGLASLLGGLLARLHGASGVEVARAIAAAIDGDIEGFTADTAAAGVAYADQIEADWHHFQRALERLGPLLGVPVDPDDQPRADLRALYGDPPPP